jgi:hypothetical protein
MSTQHYKILYYIGNYVALLCTGGSSYKNNNNRDIGGARYTTDSIPV